MNPFECTEEFYLIDLFDKSSIHNRHSLIHNAAYIDGLAQYCRSSIVNALESLQSCAKPSISVVVLGTHVFLSCNILVHAWRGATNWTYVDLSSAAP